MTKPMPRTWAAPKYRTVPVKMWAAISDDVPPNIWEVRFYKDHLERQDLRHIPVMVIPDIKKPNRKRKP